MDSLDDNSNMKLLVSDHQVRFLDLLSTTTLERSQQFQT